MAVSTRLMESSDPQLKPLPPVWVDLAMLAGLVLFAVGVAGTISWFIRATI